MGKVPYIRQAIANIFKPTVTNKYPYVKPEIPDGYRGKINFNADLCVGCGMCMRVCSPESITKVVKNIEGGQEITLNFDLGSCTFCKMCADFCARKAIEFTKEYSFIGTADSKEQLMISGTFIKKLPPKPPAKPVTAAPAAEQPKDEAQPAKASAEA